MSVYLPRNVVSPLSDERAVLLDAPRVRLHVRHESRHQVQKALAEFVRFKAGRLQLLSVPENKIATLTVLVTRSYLCNKNQILLHMLVYMTKMFWNWHQVISIKYHFLKFLTHKFFTASLTGSSAVHIGPRPRNKKCFAPYGWGSDEVDKLIKAKGYLKINKEPARQFQESSVQVSTV